MAEAGLASIVSERMRAALQHYTGGAKFPARAVSPGLQLVITELGQEPLPGWKRRVEVCHPQFNVVQRSAKW